MNYLVFYLFQISLLVSSEIIPPMGNFQCLEGICDQIQCPPITCEDGKLLNDPQSPCSCCKYCISYIAENKTCNTRAIDKECGPGLTCSNIGGSYICVKKETQCYKDQLTYDENKKNGLVGMYVPRPQCDVDGEYKGKKCQPGSSCYCVNKEDKRIFGESPPNNNSDMNCKCSRDYELAKQLSFISLKFPHCLPNGNYDPLQCINFACFCMDSDLKPSSSLVPITAVNTLPCYQADIHDETYLRSCEKEATTKQMQMDDYAKQNITIFGIEFPDCSIDGNYSPVQKRDSALYCVYPNGTAIENYRIEYDSPMAKNMNCNCARTRYWLTNQNLVKPQCCRNGNYNPIQCRGGVCFCVDQYGDQIGLEVIQSQMHTLNCTSDYVC